MRSYAHLPTRLCGDRFSSLEPVTELDEAAGDPACDRSGGQLERLADRPIRLVAGKEAAEDLAAVVGQAGHRLMDVERLVDPSDRVLVGVGCKLALLGCLLARARPQPVDAGPAGELREPRLDGLVATERVEPLVGFREDLLEDVLGVLVAKPKALTRDRVDVTGETLDESGPGRLVACAATGDELRGRNRLGHGALRSSDGDLLLLRLAEPLGHHLEELPGDLCVRLDQRPELPRGEPVAGEV